MDSKSTDSVITALISAVVGFTLSTVLFEIQLLLRTRHEQKVCRDFVYEAIGHILLHNKRLNQVLLETDQKQLYTGVFNIYEHDFLRQRHEAYQKTYPAAMLEIRESRWFSILLDESAPYTEKQTDRE